jgi:hypothetical protein
VVKSRIDGVVGVASPQDIPGSGQVYMKRTRTRRNPLLLHWSILGRGLLLEKWVLLDEPALPDGPGPLDDTGVVEEFGWAGALART